MLCKAQDISIIGPSGAFGNPFRHQIFPRADPHFFFAVWALTLPFCNFFCRCGYFVAGFLAVRLTFLDMMLPFTGDNSPSLHRIFSQWEENRSEGNGPQSCRLLPCFPFQNGQKGQSSPCGKSSPSSCGQPMFPSVIATDLTPCCWKKLPNFPLHLGIFHDVRANPPLHDRLGTIMEDHASRYLGRRLVIRAVQGHGADGELRRFLLLSPSSFCVSSRTPRWRRPTRPNPRLKSGAGSVR